MGKSLRKLSIERINSVRYDRAWVQATIAIAWLFTAAAAIPQTRAGIAKWPTITNETRPWSRWWWLGSAVDRENLTSLLTQYRAAGFGGLEICPIYGAKGAESRYLDFLSPQWMEMLAHTTTEARRIGIGVDLTDGTGWPFGGPGVTDQDASSRIVLKRFDLTDGTRLRDTLPTGSVQCVIASSSSGGHVDVTERVKDGKLDWTPPSGSWRVYAVLSQGPVQKVKRAAPGGAGNVLDPYSTTALGRYLARFDLAFAGFRAPTLTIRAHFHDSFEYYNASWTPGFVQQFEGSRGYDLRSRLPALFGEGTPDTVARVKHDFRETLSDLHLGYIRRWTEWAHRHQGITRNQAHGAPGNLLDLYAAVDIPETEIFGELDDSRLAIQKLASSAAHVAGKRLATAESFTWLGEHFQVSLSQLKPAADYLFLAGINHLVYHGIPYSPRDAAWPGWLFYASVNFGPNGGLWRDFPAFNAYVTRCQSILQGGRPDNDVLLYLPVHDLWQHPDGLVQQFPIEGKWLIGTSFHKAAQLLTARGYGWDAFSDRLLENARMEKGAIALGNGRYRAIVIPRCHAIPVETLRKLLALADAGATVIFEGSIPEDAPGLKPDRKGFEAARSAVLSLAGTNNRVRIGGDIARILDAARTPREPMAELGLRFVRRQRADGWDYFIANRGERPLDGWVRLGTPASWAILMDPAFDDRVGAASVRRDASGAEVYLQLERGESVILRTSRSADTGAAPWKYLRPSGKLVPLTGSWQVTFIEGGPALPAPFVTERLESWTAAPDIEAKRFAGTARYTITFDAPRGRAADWLLDLGRVCESARVRLNGRNVATLWRPPFRIAVGRCLKKGKNLLEVEVANLAANRIADLDRRKVDWKIFHDINFVGKDYKPFDASNWPLRDSGLLGPVTLTPVSHLSIQTRP
jgi:hypothetical protein